MATISAKMRITVNNSIMVKPFLVRFLITTLYPAYHNNIIGCIPNIVNFISSINRKTK